ncbi:uncharacterized protein Dana_GF15225 [Drosophila ananassae]|uniref:Protein phosphatase 1 regulatory subunit 35 C-terminal domain-containing protein n=1 Tax=Drosophila ananassae TaxID=7217 RepID=B3MP02_DROAN|nr:uncharacterized protein LOC6498038 [Drosophila ananassae]EDV31168.1 uncharacterized protein Dana_GF15225 [Drosophila ananassae]
MPHKRKSRVNWNQKNTATRRAQLAHPPAGPPPAAVAPDNEQCQEVEEIEPQMPAPECVTFRAPVSCRKFAVPHYNSSVRKKEEIDALNKMKAVISEANMTPSMVTAIAPRVTHKMNFPPDQAVFKDLVPLNVNDSVLVPHKQGETSKNRATKETGPKTKPEPQLADYAEKIEPIILAIPEPELHLDFPREAFDFLGAYRKIFY